MKGDSGFMSLTVLLIAGLIGLIVILGLLHLFGDGINMLVEVLTERVPG